VNQAPSKPKKKKAKRQVDTNVFSIALSCLAEQAEISSGDPIYCSTCKGIFNKFSTISASESGQVWNCEFCLAKNSISIEEEEKPKDA